jgi:hypothetical protein
MDAADKAGPKGVTDQAVRYIITRPCLAEGSLSLLKYLQPHFPADGELTLQDSRSEEFPVSIDAAHNRLLGLGELYRAHNMGVNDVLLLSRQDERRYSVACVVKPHARSQSAGERPAPAPQVTEKRVVIHATPHVREVRTERVTTPPAVTARPEQQAAEVKVAALADVNPTTAPDSGRHTPGPHSANPSVPNLSSPSNTPGSVRLTSAPITSLTARLQQRPASPSGMGKSLNTVGTPIQMTFAAPAAAQPTPAQPSQSQSSQPSVQARSSGRPSPEPRNAGMQRPVAQAPVAQAPVAQLPENLQPVALQDVVPAQVESAPAAIAAPVSATAAPLARGPVRAATLPRPEVQETVPSTRSNEVHLQDQQQAPEDKLNALARLTGYSCEHLGSGVVRLRAELGSHGYSVLIATTPQALTTPAWNESCDYMALLTPESERPQGIPRFTHAALDALLEHARLAPLTPIDLRGYWNTGSFDQESASSVAELVSAHLAQRGSFSHVLLTLAQQPAHSLVQLPRLAERLGSGVNTAELHSILETLTRPPFLALTPLPGGQYYLRSDVRELLQEFGEYADGMRRRLRPAVGATGQ